MALTVSRLRLNGLLSFLALAILICTTGCPKSGPTTLVEGKVTYKGKNVEGNVVLHCAGGRKLSGAIAGGVYHIENPPTGDAEVTVEGNEAFQGPDLKPTIPTMNKKGSKGKSGSADSDPLNSKSVDLGAKGVNPPAKYKDPKTSGLKLTIKNGKNPFDIDL